ncbi:hypothetical protein R1521_21685 [Rhizobium brockwellii]|uniref:Uncharacterized protein n=1 Tax=Rhizobium brockwellii TaxID=3019932 RepID=A0ABU3YRY4_9HYPH|nr:hypothetical protein [Rhizobium brockwellii]MDV4181113.1 hypothetical protein [Rhizobium brockwellii]MDV4188412.1 hypothetical protein [Rhizobium brockwellii]
MGSEMITAMLSDYLNAHGWLTASTTGSTLGLAYKQVMARRASTAREILLEELAHCRASATDPLPDDAATVTFRYMRAVQEGAARLNLRLLAAVIAGQTNGPGLYADEFLRWADILAGLRREEVIVLGVMQRLNDQPPNPEHATNPAFLFWMECQSILNADHGIEPHVSVAYANALLRTGLVQLASGSMDTPMVPLPTFALSNLSALLSVEGIIRSERNAVMP